MTWRIEFCIRKNVFPVRGQNNPPAEELEDCTEEIWAADTNSFPENEIEYDLAGPE